MVKVLVLMGALSPADRGDLVMLFKKQKIEMVEADAALPGNEISVDVPERHFVNGNSLTGPFPKILEMAMFGLGCFWGAERKFWQANGVYSTVVGYAAGFTPNPSYEDVCTGLTGHNEVVRVLFDPQIVNYQQLLSLFWESHNPTQGMGGQ